MVRSRKPPWHKTPLATAIKWVGALLTMVLLLAWPKSVFCSVELTTPGGAVVAVSHGQISYRELPSSPNWAKPYFRWDEQSTLSMEWEFRWITLSGRRSITFPVLLPALISLLATLAAWRVEVMHVRAWRIGLGLCPACGYDRAGLTSGAVCPECGAQADAR